MDVATRLLLLVLTLVAVHAPQTSCKVPGRILEDDADVGVGTAEEVPISSFTLTFSEPDLQIQRALPPPIIVKQAEQYQQEELYDELEDEDYDDGDDGDEDLTNFNGGTGEGSVEPIPIETMKVRFEPVTQHNIIKEDSIEDESSETTPNPAQCSERCQLPMMPSAMVVAAQQCNVELVFHRPDFPVQLDNRTRTGKPTQEREPRRLDTSLRTACGSKCVLEHLHFLRENGAPDAYALASLLIENVESFWEQAILAAQFTCAPITILPPEHILDDKEKCQLATTFMKCIRATLVENCPPQSLTTDCPVKETEYLGEEEENRN